MNYDLKLEQQEIATITRALLDAPYRVAAPILAKINAQVEKQAPQVDSDFTPTEPEKTYAA